MDDNLFLAIARKDAAALQSLLEAGADPDEFDMDGFQATPLAFACDRGEEELARLLLAGGASPDAAAFSPPLVAAAEHGFIGLVDLLLAAGADPGAADESGVPALGMAAANGYADIARRLIEAGADPRQPDHDGVTPAEAAARAGFGPLAAYIGQPGACPATHALWRNSGRRAEQAARARRKAIAEERATTTAGTAGPVDEWTFDKGIARSAYATRDFTSVAGAGDLPLATAMLDAGLDPDWALFEGHATGLMLAARSGELPMVELLLSRGADPRARTEKGLTAAHMALFKPSVRRHGPVLERLFAAGADPDAADSDGQRPLHLALRHGLPRLVEVLLQAGADPLQRDRAGRRVADWAPESGKGAEAIRALLQARQG
jgi:ankyrin repeat protein